MPDDESLGGLSAPLVEIERPPDGHHEGKQEQRKSDAQNRQSAAPLVAERVFSDESGQRHRLTPEGTGIRAQAGEHVRAHQE